MVSPWTRSCHQRQIDEVIFGQNYGSRNAPRDRMPAPETSAAPRSSWTSSSTAPLVSPVQSEVQTRAPQPLFRPASSARTVALPPPLGTGRHSTHHMQSPHHSNTLNILLT